MDPLRLFRLSRLALTLGLLLPRVGAAVPPVSAEAGVELPLWPEGVPGMKDALPPERVVNGRVYGVKVPTLTAFPADPANNQGTAVIVLPGGGYEHLAMQTDGSDYRTIFHPWGVSVFVVKYRLREYGYPAPLQDVLRAIRLVRSRAAEWGVRPDRIGVLGSSAGGHLAALASTIDQAPEGRTGSPLDAVSARPDFAILLAGAITLQPPYAVPEAIRNLVGENANADLKRHLSAELQVSARTPPTFIIQSQVDRSVPVQNSLLYYQALVAARVPVEMHLFDTGPHAFGLRPGLGPISDWPRLLEPWLREHGWIH